MGVGPKTVSCVLMFTMARAEFPVDTHVWKLALKLGWVPKDATRESTYVALNRVVPDEIKYDLHVLLVTHGKKLKNELGVLKAATVKCMNTGVKTEPKLTEGTKCTEKSTKS